MNWDDLRIVLAIARHGTLSGAASWLGVTHTTVSRRLRSCEDDYGIALFDRAPDGLRPTAAGKALLSVAERTESEVLNAERLIMGGTPELRGPLRVATFDLLYGMCRPVFASFMQRYPEIELTITSSQDVVSLTRREADVALRLSPAPPDNLIGRRVGTLRFGIFGTPELIESVGPDAPFAALPWIGFDERLENHWFDAWLQTNAKGARIVARVDESTLLIREMVQSGVGVFFLPLHDGASLQLQQIGPPLDDVRAAVWLLTHPTLRDSGRVRAFLDHAAREVPQLLR